MSVIHFTITSFTYTQEELDHLQGLSFCIYMDQFLGQYDAEYYRYMAQLERDGELGPVADVENGPSPDDCEAGPTAEDLYEMAEELECGMQRGETL